MRLSSGRTYDYQYPRHPAAETGHLRDHSTCWVVFIEKDWACYDDAWKRVMADWAFEQQHKSATLKPSE